MVDRHKAKQAADKRAAAKRAERNKVKAEQRIRELESKTRRQKATATGFLIGSQDALDVQVASNQRQEAEENEAEMEELREEVSALDTEKQELNEEADRLNREASES